MNTWSLLLIAAGFRTLVLPFENVGTDPAQDWKGSAFEEAVSTHFELAGHEIVDLQRRNRTLIELGFVPGEPISRATAIILGKELDAQRLVVGAFRPTEERLDVEARVVDLVRGATVGIVEDYAPSDELAPLSNQVAKNLFRLEAHSAPSGFADRAKRRAKLSLAALEESALARVSADPEEQRRRLEKALEHEPEYVEARLMLGRLLLRAGEPRRAIDVLVAASDEGARDRKAYFDLGMAYLAVDEWESALRVFGGLSSVDGLESASYNNQGVALMRLERFLPAIEAFQLAVGANETNATYHFNFGWSLWRSGKGAPALEQFEKASALMPWDGEVHLLLSAAASSQARTGEAEVARATALLLAPDLSDVDPAVVTGWARPVEAPGPPRKVDIAEGEDVVALVELLDARALGERGRVDDAIQLLQKSLYREPGAMDLRRELVDLLLEAGQLDVAVRELSMLLWTEPSVETHIELARVYMELEDPLKAFDEIEKALSLEPNHDEARRLREALTPPAI
ncbi:MAG: hypothetical protein BMS9Abin37_0941 [Acidobacteriota bacterium]|nr:MAG: hypothetical protein BMS9Abin37_0941 [Acidobacteriota bacterium]